MQSQPEFYLSRLHRRGRVFAGLNRPLRFTDLSLNLTGMDVDATEICELILKRAILEQEGVD